VLKNVHYLPPCLFTKHMRRPNARQDGKRRGRWALNSLFVVCPKAAAPARIILRPGWLMILLRLLLLPSSIIEPMARALALTHTQHSQAVYPTCPRQDVGGPCFMREAAWLDRARLLLFCSGHVAVYWMALQGLPGLSDERRPRTTPHARESGAPGRPSFLFSLPYCAPSLSLQDNRSARDEP